MIYSKKIMQAMRIAYNAHHGQLDKEDVPYIFHPAHVAEKMTSENATIVALLHDVVEDTNLSLQDLEKEGFDSEVYEAIELLTHDEKVPYMDYIKKIKDNKLAREVKIADLLHNSDKTRDDTNSERTKKRNEKYAEALKELDYLPHATNEIRKQKDKYFEFYDDLKSHRHKVYDW